MLKVQEDDPLFSLSKHFKSSDSYEDLKKELSKA